MISYPEEVRPKDGGLYVLVNREGPESGRFGEVAWMTREVVEQENEERRANDDPAMWHHVQYAHVDDFPAATAETVTCSIGRDLLRGVRVKG